MTCQQCAKEFTEQFEAFAIPRKISRAAGVPMLRDMIVAYIQTEFTGLFEFLRSPDQWFGPDVPALYNLRVDRLVLEVVMAPASFEASCLRARCPSCRDQVPIVVVNAAFLIMLSHVLASGLGVGLGPARLRGFFDELEEDASAIERYPAPAAIPREAMFAGITWLACHEIGHETSKAKYNLVAMGVPEEWREEVDAELGADHAALASLRHRIMARGVPLDAHYPRLETLYAGVELMLRGFAMRLSLDGNRAIGLEGFPPVLDSGAPSPTLRWRTLRRERDALGKTYFVGRSPDWTMGGLLNRWDETVRRIVEG